MKEYLVSPGVIAVVSLLMILLPVSVVAYAFQGAAFLSGDWWRMLTFPFVHVDARHFGQNMVALLFSAALAFELAMGLSAYSIIFAGANVVLAVLAVVFFPETYLAGTSFGIYAVLGGLGLQKNPYVRVRLLFGILLMVALIGLFTQTRSSSLHVLGFGIGSMIFMVCRSCAKKQRVFTIGS